MLLVLEFSNTFWIVKVSKVSDLFINLLFFTDLPQKPINICQKEKQSELDKEEKNLSAEQIREFFLDYHKRKQKSLGYLNEEEPGAETTEPEGSGEEEEQFQTDKKSETPRHVKYVTQARELCNAMIHTR